MRILIVTAYFPPLNSIASLRPYSWAKYWSKAGHDVTVLTTSKDLKSPTDLSLPTDGFSTIEVPLPKILTSCKQEYLNVNITKHEHRPSPSFIQKFKQKIFSSFNTIRNKTGILNSCRMPDITDFWVRPSLKEIQDLPSWDLVISTAGPYTTHVLAAAIKKRGQAAQWVADYRDKWSDSIIYPGLFPFNLIETALEKSLLAHANAITTVSAPFASTYSQKFPNTKIVTIENGFDPSDLALLDLNPIFPPDNKFRIVYTGSFYPGKQDPSPLFNAITFLLHTEHKHLLDNLEILFVGNNLSPIQPLIVSSNLHPWVKLHKPVSRQDALRMQRDAHLLLFLTWTDPSTDGIFTGKLFEYLFSQTPILAIGSKQIEVSQKLILEAKAGTPLTNPDEIASFLIKNLLSPKKQKNSIDPNILNRYNRQFLAMKLLKSIQ